MTGAHEHIFLGKISKRPICQICDRTEYEIELERRLEQATETITNLLPDNYSQSKDWQAGNSIERILWLKAMFENKKAEITQLEQTIEAQAKRLEAAEKVCKLVKYKQHNANCDYVTHRMIDEPCNCGAWLFNKAFQNWRQVREGQ